MTLEQIHFWHPQTVRWGDMDALAHVNNATYFSYCESARIAFFGELGVGSVDGQIPRGPVLATASLNFRKQVRFPAELNVGISVSRIGSKSFTLAYAIVDRDDKTLVADGESVVVWYDYVSGNSLKLTDALRERLGVYFFQQS